MECDFTLQDAYAEPKEYLRHGRWANADVFVYEHSGVDWVLKDFTRRALIFRATAARFAIWREMRAMKRLQGIDGVPENPVLLARWAIVYPFIHGRTVRDAKDAGQPFTREYFEALEELVFQMHARHVVHLDMRNGRNLLVRENGLPALLDFQTCMFTDHMPGRLERLLRGVDLSGVYKYWEKLQPESLGDERRAHLERIKRLRRFWKFQGYPVKKMQRAARHAKRRRRADEAK